MKKLFVLILMFALVLNGCSNGENSESETAADKEMLYVYNWGLYIDQDVIKMFEDETGIKVVYNEFEQNEDMYPIIKTGAVKYDVVCPSDYMIEKMIKENMLYPLNYDNIPNIKNIDPLYLTTAEQFDPGNAYSVPYCWGTVGILYNKSMVEEPIDSWSVLFDKKYQGNILMIDSVRDAFMVALTYLGYDLNTTNETELDAARDLLKLQYPLVQAYVIDQVRDKMIAGEAALGVIYSGEAIYTQRENSDLEYVVPTEGSNIWIDGWVIPENAKNKDNAEKWIDFMLRPDIALMNFEYITYSTPNAAARDLIEDEEIKNSPVAFPSAEVLRRCGSYRYLGDEWDEIYMNKWNEVKSE